MQKTIISISINATSVDSVIEKIKDWCMDITGRYVCFSNVHMCMEAFDDPAFKRVLDDSSLTLSDGLPLVWAQKILGNKNATQIRGMDLMLTLCEVACKENIPVGLFGATPELLKNLETLLSKKFTGIDISYSESPPFREITTDEDQGFIEKINSSGVKILFVGLGCPKQEKWMADHKDSLHCTMLGVGAAFDFISGGKKHAPYWMQKTGLEWLFRLASEPKRLWKRYLKHNPRFVYYFILQLLGKKVIN